MEDGLNYIISKEGLIKFIVILFGCLTFSLLAASDLYLDKAMEWVLAAFIISFAFSVLFYFFRLIKLAPRMNCGGPCSYDGFDFVWSWFSTIWCLAAAITFAMSFSDWNTVRGEAIASVIFAFFTAVAYAVEAFFLRLYAPANIGYVATKPGWIKTALVTFGAATFGLMVDSDFPWCPWGEKGCTEGTTYALAVFCTAWTVTTLMWFGHMAAPKGSIDAQPSLKKVEFVWAIIGALFFLTGASCFAAYMDCTSTQIENNEEQCQKRLSGVIAGFITGVIYIIEAIMLRSAVTN